MKWRESNQEKAIGSLETPNANAVCDAVCPWNAPNRSVRTTAGKEAHLSNDSGVAITCFSRQNFEVRCDWRFLLIGRFCIRRVHIFL